MNVRDDRPRPMKSQVLTVFGLKWRLMEDGTTRCTWHSRADEETCSYCRSGKAMLEDVHSVDGKYVD